MNKTFLHRDERAAAGRAIRTKVPRTSHAAWKKADGQRDPIDILEKSNRGRVKELVPIRYGRMARNAFAFLRGSAAVMARDLSKTPVSGIDVQLCGDAHLMNFGLFATPERKLIFDLNDFDETHPGPWEWDLKRLAVSFIVAARAAKGPERDGRDVAMELLSVYRTRMREFASMSPMEVWYTQLEWESVVSKMRYESSKKLARQVEDEARRRLGEHLFPKIAESDGGKHRLIDQPPVLFHSPEKDAEERVRDGIAHYRATLSEERRVLLNRYRLEDFAFKVVGIGSVGTRCFIALFISADGDPLLLQFKEARQSVLEPYTRESIFGHQGQRVVAGQRLMQSSSDIFLGWASGKKGNEFFVRQLRDMKMSIPVETLSAALLRRYTRLCGWALARAHAKSGDAAMISGYLGKSDRFDRAVTEFAVAYADQTERDHAALVKAIRGGRVEALTES